MWRQIRARGLANGWAKVCTSYVNLICQGPFDLLFRVLSVELAICMGFYWILWDACREQRAQDMFRILEALVHFATVVPPKMFD